MADVTAERRDDVLSINVGGYIDGANVAKFEEAINAAIKDTDSAVIMDFEKLVYISSAGLRTVVLMAKSLQNRNAKLLLSSLAPPIRTVFEISGFDKVLPIHPTKAEALAFLDG